MYASLFMENFEKDFLESSDVQPFLWFRLLGDIFMIWDNSKENLLNFLDNLYKFHETIKCTYNFSKHNAILLDVKMFMSIEGTLHASAFGKKNTYVHQFIEFSSCHPLLAKRVSHLAKLNDIDV